MLKIGKILLETQARIAEAKTWREEQDATLHLAKLVVPEMIVTGATEFPPPFEDENEVALLFSNHVANVDQVLLLSKISYHYNKKYPVQCSGFTYSSFQYVPIIGEGVGRNCVGLEEGEADSDIEQKVCWLLDQGFNTWILFPEGTLFTKKKYEKSIDFQTKELKMSKDKLFHYVLYPKVRALNAFLKALKQKGKRLKYIVDLTLEYPNVNLWERVDTNYTYPSLLYGSFCTLPRPSLHCHIYTLDDSFLEKMYASISTENPPKVPIWLLNIWKRKENTLRKKAQLRKRSIHRST